jgi:hypothetical protein
MKRFLKENGLSIVFFLLFLITILGQAFTGYHELIKEINEKEPAFTLTFSQYLSSGHFFQATFENWESEFLQMALFVILTISLKQKGSSESKKLEGNNKVDKEPNSKKKDAPWL